MNKSIKRKTSLMNSAEPNVDYDDEHSLVYPVVAIHAGHDLLAASRGERC